MKKIRFGVIGCGYIAKKAFLPAIKISKVAKLVAIASRDKNKAKLFSTEFECNYENNYESLLSRKDIDAIYIATIPSTHEKLILLAAKYGKHILCEKPLTISNKSAKKIVDYCKEKKVGVFEGFMYQFHRQHKKLKDLVNKGHIGEPILFTASFGFPLKDENNYRYKYEFGGGACLDAGCYTIHAARHFFQSEPINIYSIINKNGKDVDLNGTALLDFGNCHTAQLSFGFNNYYRNTYSIWGTKGHISSERAFSIPPNLESKLILQQQDYYDEIICEPDDNFVSEINYFCNSLSNSKNFVTWGNEILKQSIVVEKIMRS